MIGRRVRRQGPAPPLRRGRNAVKSGATIRRKIGETIGPLMEAIRKMRRLLVPTNSSLRHRPTRKSASAI